MWLYVNILRKIYLVGGLEHFFPYGNNDPNWLIFFRGVGLNHQPALKKTGSTWIQPLSGDPWWPRQDLGIDGKIEAGLDGESFDCEMEELRPKRRLNYPLVNIQKTMENYHFQWENPL